MNLFVFMLCFAMSTSFLHARDLPSLPVVLPQPDATGVYKIPTNDNKTRALRLDSSLSLALEDFIKNNGNDIAAAVVVDVKTGSILAMAQGRHPYNWNSQTHTALFGGFPAASLFKTVPTTAIIDIMDLDPNEEFTLLGGCSKVNPQGSWLTGTYKGPQNVMTLQRAFAYSCNSFYAKVAVNNLGLNVINSYAGRFGWGQEIPVDFYIKPSSIASPDPKASSVQTVGLFSAGFGPVGMSAIHAAWMYLTIARNGYPISLKIFQDTPDETKEQIDAIKPIFKPETGPKLRNIMNKTIFNGSAAWAFRKKGYRHLIPLVGGKTGTLTGTDPKGLTTWFTGLMPYDNPEIVVASVVVLTGDRWMIKGPLLAAEAFRLYDKQKQDKLTVAKNSNKK